MRTAACSFDTRTLALPRPKPPLEAALLALGFQSKNLYNTANFIVRQIFSAYQYDAQVRVSRLKADLHASQSTAIDHLNIQIARINAARIDKHPVQVEKARMQDKAPPELALVPALGAVMPNLARTLLDATVVDNAARTWKNEHDAVVYKRLPAAMAQQVIIRLRQAYAGFFTAMKTYAVAPHTMTGRPRMPGYLVKHDRFVLELPMATIAIRPATTSTDDEPAQAERGFLPSLKGKDIPVDYAETATLAPDVLAAFGTFDVLGAIRSACGKRGWTDCTPQHLRIVPRHSGVKMEVVVRVPNAYPAHSFLASLYSTHGTALAALGKEADHTKWLISFMKDIPFADLPRIASMDLGVSNLVAVAYSTGDRGDVHSGAPYEVVLERMNDAVDAFVSSQTPPQARELQAKQNDLSKHDKTLSPAEHCELSMLLKAIYTHPAYRRLTEKRATWQDNYLHRLSRGLVRQCASRGIDVIVIGKNTLWKQGCNMGTTQNRRFGQVPHARLIELIRYKAQSLGIAVLICEESYTSKTSFVDNEPLRCYMDKKVQVAQVAPEPEIRNGTIPVRCLGYRSRDRQWFVRTGKKERCQKVHADINAAFNICRKIFTHFAWHVGLNLKFVLWRLSDRCGVIPIRS